MAFFRKGEYQDAPNLQQLAQLMVKASPELSDAKGASFVILYSLNELDHIGGKCRKLDGSVKFHTKTDFHILIHQGPFLKSGFRDRLRILAHELYHIEETKHGYKVRHHSGDFCEIQEHDKFSYKIAEKVAASLEIELK